MDPNSLTQSAVDLANEAAALAAKAAALAQQTTMMVAPEAAGGGVDMLTMGLTVFVLACFVGYYVVWRGTPAPPSPPVSVTHPVSNPILRGAPLPPPPPPVRFSPTLGPPPG